MPQKCDDPICFDARVLRKRSDLPRYIVVPPDHVPEHGPDYGPDRTKAFLALVTLNETGPFERNIRPWGKGSDVFFFNLTAEHCTKAGLETNDTCAITILPIDR